MPNRNASLSTKYRGWFFDQLNNLLEAYHGTTRVFNASASALGFDLPFGYATGAGGTVTQITNRSTGVTLNTICGAITTDSTSLAAGAEATFVVTNSKVAATDVVVVSMQTITTGLPMALVTDVSAGSFSITLTNLDGATADTSADVINFAVIKSVSA